jgi:hypothetical protein
VVNEIEYVDSWGAINSTLSGIANSPAFLSQLTNNTKYTDPNGRAPNVAFTGGTQAVPALTGLGNGSAPYFERNIDKNIFDNVSIQRGNHNIRAGFTAMWMQKTENASSGFATFTFSPTNGNPAFANFLLGQADSYTQPSKDTIPHLNYVNFEVYVQDDWKITPRLTLNAGVRWSYFPSPTDSNNTLVNFNPNLFKAANAAVIDPISGNMTGVTVSGTPTNAATYTNGLIFPSGAACKLAQAIAAQVACSPFGSRVNPNSNNNWGPRLGLAYDPYGNGKMAIRAGFGIFYDRTLNGIWEQNAFTDPPLVQTVTVNNTGQSSLNVFDDPLGGQVAGPSLGPNGLIATGTPSFKVPSYMDYTVSLQREIMPNTVIQVGYVGTKGTHLLGDVEINQPTLAARLANPGVDANALRPYAGYGAITDRNPVYTSNYNSLQAELTRRFSRGLTVQLSYTWSKLLTTNSVDRATATYNTYNLKQSYGPSTLNTPHMFVASYVYDFPFYRAQRGFIGKVLGGWEISGITTVQSGQSLSITQNSDPFGLSPLYPGGLGMTRSGSTVQIRADQIGNASGPKTAAKFFNTAAFTDAVGHFGTSSAGAIYGPGFQVWDLSLIKNVRFAERVGLQLRLETFNTFNHGSPSTIDTDVDDGASFGTVNGWHDPRNVQIGAKINF